MGIKYVVIQARDGRYCYGAEAARAELAEEPRGLFDTMEEAHNAIVRAFQTALDAGRPERRS